MVDEVRADPAEADRQRLERIDALRREMHEVTATACSPDGLVRVEVGLRGRLNSLHIEPQAYERFEPQRLATMMVELINQAGKEVIEREQAIVAEHVPQVVAERLRLSEDDLSAY
jgi:DNA-binding protein YbaB